MSDWWKFDKDDDALMLEPAHVTDDGIEANERVALAAVDAIARMADTQPEKALIIGAALRKISTVAQSKAQTLSLNTVRIRRGRL